MLKDSVEILYNALERIGESHQEVYDTDVREQLAETLYFAFVWGHSLPPNPIRYGMFSADGDKAVALVVSTFLKDALAAASTEGIGVGAPRHAVIQDSSIVTKGGQTYDNFIGHSDDPFDLQELPSVRFEPGEHDA